MKPALLLIDLQEDYLGAAGLEPGAGAVCEAAARLLGAARDAGVPVVHVWTTIREDAERMPHWRATNRRRCVEGTPGHATPAPLRPLEGETVVHKQYFSAFTQEGLAASLRDAGVDTVILAGIYLRACVRTTALDAYQQEFQVRIALDAVGDDDPVHAALTRQYLGARGISFPTVAEIARSLPGAPPPTADAAPLLPALLPDGVAERREDAPCIPHHSPREAGTVLWRVPAAGPAETATAVAEAGRAGQEWARTPIQHRIEIFSELLNRMEDRSESLARQIALETGKPVREARQELRYAAGLVEAALRLAPGSEVAAQGECWTAYRRPHGVVAAITPWNNPLAIPLGKIAPALLHGNTVVWKPAIPGAAIAREVFCLLGESGCPAGAVVVLNGDASTAEALISQPGVAAVTLTGSSAAGSAAQVLCARRRVPLQAELGGNNAAIVWPDADLPEAARLLARGGCGAAGQRCTASRRVIVAEECYAAFLALLTAEVRALQWGDPLEEATDVGPLISEAARERVSAAVRRAGEAGAMVLQPHAAEGLEGRGAYYPPTLVCDSDPAAEIVQEETFGPVLVIQRVRDWEEALERCNGVRQGLVATLYSHCPERQESFRARAQAGMLRLNVPPAGAAPDAPFCAWKDSGTGPPEHGVADREFYSKYQTVYG